MPARKPPSERFERLLAQAEAVPHQQSRDDATTQQRHDVITARMVHALERKSAAARLERQRVDRHLATRLQRVMGSVVNVEAVQQQLCEPPSARQVVIPASPLPLTGRGISTHTGHASDVLTGNSNNNNNSSSSRMMIRKKASKAMLPSARSARRVLQDIAVDQSTGHAAGTPNTLASHTSAAQPVSEGGGQQQQPQQHEKGHKNSNNEEEEDAERKAGTLCTAYYTLGFPTAFEQSGFHSLTRWADVSFQETIMAAFGPRAPHTRLREGAMPHRLLVTVACYLLNEVLGHEPTLGALWLLLRESIFDAVFSPRLIEAERAAPLTYTDIHQREHEEDERVGGWRRSSSCTAQSPPPHRPQTASWLAQEAADRAACMPALTPHSVSYEHLTDFARYALWTEEVTSVTKQNAYLAERVRALKEIVRRSVLVLHMAQRRADAAWKRRVFWLWRNYSRRAHAARRAATTYLVHRRQRVLEDICFLRWRRITLQSKIEALQKERARLDQETQRSAQAHKLAMVGLRNELEKEQETRQVIEVQHAAAQAQLHESHRLESQALNYALTRQLRRGEALTKCLRRWERIAKTFRPATLCPRPPRALLFAGTELRQLEDELAWMRKESHARLLRHRQVSAMLEKFVLLWVNQVMRHEPERGKSWTEVTKLERTRDTVAGGTTTSNNNTHSRSRRRLNNTSTGDDFEEEYHGGRGGGSGYTQSGTRAGGHRDRNGVFTYDTLHSLVQELQRLYSGGESTITTTSSSGGGGTGSAGRSQTPPLPAHHTMQVQDTMNLTGVSPTRRASPRAVTLMMDTASGAALAATLTPPTPPLSAPPPQQQQATAAATIAAIGGAIRVDSASHTRPAHTTSTYYHGTTNNSRHKRAYHASDGHLLLTIEASEALFHAVCTVLYLQTDEGLTPSLLAHCPYLRHFLSPAAFTTPMPRVGMLWLLCALFVGYVQRCCGSAAFLPTMWPASLQCQQELSVAGHVSSAITVHGPEVDLPMTAAMVQAVAGHVMPSQRARRRSLSRRSTHGSSFVSRHTQVHHNNRHGSPMPRTMAAANSSTSNANMSPRAPLMNPARRYSGHGMNESITGPTTTTTTTSGHGLAMPNATFAPTGADSRHNSLSAAHRRSQGSVSLVSAAVGGPQSQPQRRRRTRTRTRRGLQLCDVDLVCDGVDTVSDMEVYLGIKDEYFPHEYYNDDVDALLKDAASAETRAMKQKLRRRHPPLGEAAAAGGDTKDETRRSRSAGSNTSRSSAAASQRTSSSSSSSSSSSASSESTSRSRSSSSASASRLGDEEEEMASEMADSVHEMKGKVDHTNSSSSNHHSHSHSHSYNKGKEQPLSNTSLEQQQQEGEERGQTAGSGEQEAMNHTGGAASLTRGQSAQPESPLRGNTPPTLTVRQTRLLAQLLAPSRAFDVVRHRHHHHSNNNNNGGSGGGGVNGAVGNEDEDDDEDEEVRRERERKVRRVALHTFVQRIVLDAQRRRQWLGLARVLQSLLLRFRVLDFGVPNAWLRGRTHIAAGAAGAGAGGGGGNGGGSSGQGQGSQAQLGYIPLDLTTEPTPHIELLLTNTDNNDALGGSAAGHRERMNCSGRTIMTPPEHTLSRPGSSGYAPSGRTTRVVLACEDSSGLAHTTPSNASVLSPHTMRAAGERPASQQQQQQQQQHTPPSHRITSMLHNIHGNKEKEGCPSGQDVDGRTTSGAPRDTDSKASARHTPLPSIVVPPVMLSSAITPSPTSTRPTSPTSQRLLRPSPSQASLEERPFVQAKYGTSRAMMPLMRHSLTNGEGGGRGRDEEGRHLSLAETAEGQYYDDSNNNNYSYSASQHQQAMTLGSRQASMSQTANTNTTPAQGVTQSWPAHPLGALVIQPPPGARALTQQQQQQAQHRYRFNLKDVHRRDHM